MKDADLYAIRFGEKKQSTHRNVKYDAKSVPVKNEWDNPGI